MILLCPHSAAGAGDFSSCWFAAARVPGVRSEVRLHGFGTGGLVVRGFWWLWSAGFRVL